MDTIPAYVPRHAAVSRHLEVRGLRYHLWQWGGAAPAGRGATVPRPPVVMLHGWMDVGASFQFVVDALAPGRTVFAPDWRGFGLTEGPPVDSYWFPDYLGDLDALLDALAPECPVDLLGHSMGGNVAMGYAGVRPERVRRLVNLEGFGLPHMAPARAPERLAQWLDELKTPAVLRTYADTAEVATRLIKTNPRLTPDKASWLAKHWARQGDDGQWHIQGDPAHKRVNPVPYRADEAVEYWKRITAPVLWVEGDDTDILRRWSNRYPRAEFEARLALVPQVRKHVLPDSGHMLHHDQPQALAASIDAFLN